MEQRKGFSKDFWMVVIGQIISLFGNAVVRFALPIHLLEVTGSAALLGIVSGCAFIPLAVMAPIGGMIADRVNKRNIMVCLDFFTAGLTIVFLILYGKVNLAGLILVMLFLLYGIGGAYQPSVQASIPVLVEGDKVMTANAVINMVSSLSGLLGPALGGIAYSMWGIIPVLTVAAGCFGASAVLEIFIHIPFVKRKREMSVWRETGNDLKSSLSYIVRDKKVVGKLTVCCTAVNLIISSAIIIGLPVIVMQVLEFKNSGGSTMYGFMQAILAVGGLAGGLGAGIFSKKISVKKSWKLLLYAGILLIPMGIALMAQVSSIVTYVILAVAGMFIMAMSTLYSIQIMAYIQVTVPAEMLGKVISWIIAVSTCAQPLGQVVYGFLFENMKNNMYLIFFAAAVAAVLIACYNKKIAEEL